MTTSLQESTNNVAACTRSTKDYDEDDLTGPNFIDHFSLRDPSSTVKFRGSRVHVYEAFSEQILLEDRRSSKDGESQQGVNRHSITVKRIPNATFGLRFLRLSYSLIALLIFGFSFALCFQIILFLFVNLAATILILSEVGVDDEAQATGEILSTICSIPVWLFGLSSFMAMASTFVSEAWTGGFLIRAVFGAPAVLSELLYFVFFLAIPLLTYIGANFAQVNNTWELACYAWLACVGFLFLCFALGVVVCEVRACFKLLSIHYEDVDEAENRTGFRKFLVQVQRSILLVQKQKYSGRKKEQYLVTAEDVCPKGGYTLSEKHNPGLVKKSIYTRITQLGCMQCMYETLKVPHRIYSAEEVRDVLPFVTKHSWSLEYMFCSRRQNRRVISAKGPSAVTRQQILSSFACTLVGMLFIILFIIGFLVWMQTGWMAYTFVSLCAIFCCLMPIVKGQLSVIQLYNDINQDDLEAETMENKDTETGELRKSTKTVSEEASLYRLWETSRVTEPKPWVCYVGMFLEFVLLFVFPLSTLFSTGSNTIGWLFLLTAFFSFLRNYFDGAAILCELGSMSEINVRSSKKEKAANDDEETLVKKARLGEIVGNISRSDSVNRWMVFFGILVVFVMMLFEAALSSNDGLGERPPIILVDDYAYAPEDSLQYPTCSMSKGFEISVDGVEKDTALGDYAFLSALAYETTDVTSYILPQWFGDGVAVDENEFVREYREGNGSSSVPVYFKLFTFPDVPDLGVIAIRGSQTSWDWMVNMQLWSSSGLAQLVKWMLPFGWMWTPILDDLVRFLNFIEAGQLQEISYYRTTTAAAKDFKETYGSLRVTGASLGGGIAIITGAQAQTPSVAISGLGVELARNAVDPPVTMDDINKYVFNFMPDRDYIARIGGRPRQHQEAQCSAPTSNAFGCHSMWRSVCEINFRCGTQGRPVICRCHYQFGYPLPEPVGNTTRSFEEACIEEEQAFLGATGSSVTASWW